jgi:transcriptional regulator with XRE-family HTH domain
LRAVNARVQEALRFIGANVRALRQQAGITQEALAEAVGVELRTVQRIEGGKTNLGVAVLVELAHALGAQPAALLKETKVPEVKRGRPKRDPAG